MCFDSTIQNNESEKCNPRALLAERQKLKGIIVVAGYDSDLGDANERRSGYFDRPFDWQGSSRPGVSRGSALPGVR
jgi:hypothetical protein